MTPLAFFTGSPNPDHRTLDDILADTDDALEHQHDIIQWCFPLHEPSRFNPDAPLVTKEEQRTLSTTPAIQQKMRQVLTRWLSFYGFHLTDHSLTPTPDFPTQSRRWNHPLNHNHLRITRIIRSLRLFGLDPEAQQVHHAFSTFARSPQSHINPATPAYWHNALHGPLFAPITNR